MTYIRPENHNKVDIIEVVEGEETITVLDDIEIKSPFIKFGSDDIKTYIIAERHEGDGIVSIDYVYGKIDLPALESSREALKKCMETIISRENIDNNIKRQCGLIPTITVNSLGELESSLEPEIVRGVIDGVLRSSHRQVVKEKNTEGGERRPAKKEADYKKIARWFKETDEEMKKRPPKSKRFRDKLFGRSSNDEGSDNSGRDEVLAEEADIESATEFLVVFYNSGLVIRDGSQILRYNICSKDMSSGRLSGIQSFLMSGVDEEKMKYEGNYRDTFVNKICYNILIGARDGYPEVLGWRWPYVGEFSASSDLGLVESKEAQKFFARISGVDRDRDDDSRVL